MRGDLWTWGGLKPFVAMHDDGDGDDDGAASRTFWSSMTHWTCGHLQWLLILATYGGLQVLSRNLECRM